MLLKRNVPDVLPAPLLREQAQEKGEEELKGAQDEKKFYSRPTFSGGLGFINRVRLLSISLVLILKNILYLVLIV